MGEILTTLKRLSDTRGEEIERWFAMERQKSAPFIYTSVDLRHSGVRLAPVDTNLFPAGFNNLSPAARGRAARFLAAFFAERYPDAKRVVIIPENHTRNLYYLENLVVLTTLFEAAGKEVRLGSLAAVAGAPIELASQSGARLVQYPVQRDGVRLVLEDGFVPEVVVLNNDMTSGVPTILEGLAQPVLPSVGMGWHRRRKRVHFTAYQKLVESFAAAFSLDPWLLGAEFHGCGMVDFKERTGLDCVAKAIDMLIARAKKKYHEYGIAEDPYVYVKADSGTYGMGILTVRSGSEILDLNKKERNKMNVIKEGARVSEVIVQEGIPTIDSVDGHPAEPMVYLVDGIPAGGMWRVNEARDAYGNLNAAGMHFTGMCDEMEEEGEAWRVVEGCHFRSFGVIAAIAALAAAREEYGN